MCGNKELLAVVVAMAMNSLAFAQQPPSSLDVVRGTVPAGLPGLSSPAQTAGPPSQPAPVQSVQAAAPVAAPAPVAVKMPAGYVPQAPVAQPAAQGMPLRPTVMPGTPEGPAPVKGQPQPPNLNTPAASQQTVISLPLGGLTINTLAKVQKMEMEKTVAKKLSDLGYGQEQKQQQQMAHLEPVAPPPKPKHYVQFVGGPVGKEFAKIRLSSGEVVEIAAGQTVKGIHVISVNNGRILIGKPQVQSQKGRRAVKQAWIAPGDFIK